MTNVQRRVSSIEELLPAAADAKVAHIALAAALVDVPTLRLQPGQSLSGAEAHASIELAAGHDGLQLQAGAETVLQVDASPELSLYVLQGRIKIGGSSLSAGDLGMLGSGTQIRIAAQGADAVEVALIGGQPVQGKVLFSGPFVMDTPERLAQARRDFATGRMGRLDGVPH